MPRRDIIRNHRVAGKLEQAVLLYCDRRWRGIAGDRAAVNTDRCVAGVDDPLRTPRIPRDHTAMHGKAGIFFIIVCFSNRYHAACIGAAAGQRAAVQGESCVIKAYKPAFSARVDHTGVIVVADAKLRCRHVKHIRIAVSVGYRDRMAVEADIHVFARRVGFVEHNIADEENAAGCRQ